MITTIDDYFALGCGRCKRFATADCSTRKWALGLLALRELCLDMKLVETIKWGHPCYMHADRNIAIIGALRSEFRLNFFNAALLKDAHGVLERRGPHTKHPDMIRFSTGSQVAAMEDVIRSYVRQAKRIAEHGIKPPKSADTLELPHELAMAFEADPVLALAFKRLTPGRQRSYVINLISAKKSETRMSRIAAFRDRILAGKGALER